MPGQPIILSCLKSGILLAMSLTLTGCLLDEGGFETGGSQSNGVSLSQAMHASASGSTESLHGSGSGSTQSYTPVDTDVNAAVVTSSAVNATPVADPGRDYTFQIPLDVSYAVPFSGEFRSITRFTLTPLCMENDQYAVGLFLSGDIVDVKPGTLPAAGIDNTWMLEGGVSGRVYLNPAHAFISPYVAANIAYQVLFWDYRNPVFVDGQEIQSDALPGMGGYVGLGVAFNRNSHVSVFGEAGFGGTVFTEQTAQGFENDVFHNFGYFSVKAGLCIKF